MATNFIGPVTDGLSTNNREKLAAVFGTLGDVLSCAQVGRMIEVVVVALFLEGNAI